MSLALERRVLVRENKAGANSLAAVQFASRGQSCRRAAALTDGLCHLALIPQKMIGLNWSARFPTTGMLALMSGLARIPVPLRLKWTGRRKGEHDGAAMATKQAPVQTFPLVTGYLVPCGMDAVDFITLPSV